MGPFATEREAHAAAMVQADQLKLDSFRSTNYRLLLDTCGAARVLVGAYDVRIIEWLANYEPATCAVIAGLISRANGGPSEVVEAEIWCELPWCPNGPDRHLWQPGSCFEGEE